MCAYASLLWCSIFKNHLLCTYCRQGTVINSAEYKKGFYNEVEKIKYANYFNTRLNVMEIREEN